MYNEEFLTDLSGLLSINPAKKPQPNETDDEQVATTITSIKNCIKLEKETDRSFKMLPKTTLGDKETINNLKGKRHSFGFILSDFSVGNFSNAFK